MPFVFAATNRSEGVIDATCSWSIGGSQRVKLAERRFQLNYVEKLWIVAERKKIMDGKLFRYLEARYFILFIKNVFRKLNLNRNINLSFLGMDRLFGIHSSGLGLSSLIWCHLNNWLLKPPTLSVGRKSLRDSIWWDRSWIID